MMLKITHKGNVLSSKIRPAESFSDRLIGLMFRKEILGAEGLMIDPCRSIHTCFMKYSLDIVFISSKNQVVKVIRDIKPWRMTWIYFSANKTLELPAGKLPKDIKEGDFLEISHV